MNEKINIENNALVFPAINDFKGYGRFIHGIKTDSTKKLIEYGLSRNGEIMTKLDLRKEFENNESSKKISLKGTYLYCGPLSHHFGHMLTDCANRLWSCTEYQDKCDGIIFLPDQKNYSITPLHNELFKLFNVDQNKIIYLENFAEVEQLLIPNIGTSLGAIPKEWYKEKLKKIIDKDLYYDMSKPKKIIVSRKNFTHVGRVAGTDGLINYLKNDDYFEFCPEKYKLSEQISYILSAEKIIWEEGSALHLLEIIPEISANSFMIRRRPDFNEFDILLNSKSTCTPIIYNNISYLDLDVVPHNRMSKFNDIDELIKLLVENNFLSQSPNSLHNFLSIEFFNIQTAFHKEIKNYIINKK